MKVDKVYDFFFHPYSDKHSPKVKAFSTLAIIALSLLTGGGYLVALGIMQWRDRKITVHNSKTHKITPIAAKTISSTSSSQKVDQAQSFNLSRLNEEKVKHVKAKNAEQLKLFEKWAEEKDWKRFRPEFSHYDWWAFPIDRPSAGYDEEYAVYSPEIEALKADEEFMCNLRRGAELVAKSWGWDLKKDALVSKNERTPYQQWTGYGVRLGKMANSLKLFGQEDLYKSLQHFFDEVCLPQIRKYPLEDWVYRNLGR